MAETGMIVPCSLQESICKNMVESQMKALLSNALYNTDVEYEQAQYDGLGNQITVGQSITSPSPYTGANSWGPVSVGGSGSGLAAYNAWYAGEKYATPFASTSQNMTGYDSSFAGAMSTAVGNLPTPAWGTLPAAPALTGGGGSVILPSGPAFTGWGCTMVQAGIGVRLYMALAKNTTSVHLPYFIFRWQFGGPELEDLNAPGGPQMSCVPGVTYTVGIITVVSSGIVLPGQVIGPGQVIPVPFPTTQPIPLTSFGNTNFNGDQYTAVIGMDPAAYFNLAGLTPGTNTLITT